jgi:hypothetical protein
MYTLDTIEQVVKYSANGNVILTQTVVNTIAAIGFDRKTMSVQDVTYVIHNNLVRNSDKEFVTEQKVATMMKKIAKDCAEGYKYHGLKSLTNLDGYFFQYGK